MADLARKVCPAFGELDGRSLFQKHADLRSPHLLRVLLAVKQNVPSAPAHEFLGRNVGVAVPSRGRAHLR